MEVIDGGKRAFAPGDVVALKSGGIPMTILAIRDGEVADLMWVGAPDKICKHTVPLVCLQPLQAPQKQG